MVSNIIKQKYLVLFVLLGLLSILPFLRSGFFTMHDDTQVARVYEMGKMLSQGILPVRWVPDLGYGYGYPLFNFYAPLAYYLGGILVVIGIPALVATKIMLSGSIIFAGFGMYLLARQLWGEAAGFLAGMLYLYAPYHALNTYVRGDGAELVAYALLPFLFWAAWRLYTRQTYQNLILTACLYGLVIISHNLSAMMITPFFLVFCFGAYFFLRKNKLQKTRIFLLLAPFIGILLASFYWIPVFAEMKYTNVLSQVGGNADFRNHFVCLSQLWSSPWLYGGSVPGCVDGMSYRIGKLHILLGFVGMILGVVFIKKNKEKGILTILFSLGYVFSIFLLLPVSQFLWEAISHMAFFQYPWRFLLMTAFFVSLLGGSVVWSLQFIIPKSLQKVSVVLTVGIATLILLVTSAKIFVPQTYLAKTNDEYTSEKELKGYASSLTDEYLPPHFRRPQKGQFVTEKFTVRSGQASVTKQEEGRLQYSADVRAMTKSELLINHAYFPTWHVYINGKISEFGYFNRGLIVTVPKGTYNIVVRYSQTPSELVANSISLLTFGVLLLIAFYPKLKRLYAK